MAESELDGNFAAEPVDGGTVGAGLDGSDAENDDFAVISSVRGSEASETGKSGVKRSSSDAAPPPRAKKRQRLLVLRAKRREMRKQDSDRHPMRCALTSLDAETQALKLREYFVEGFQRIGKPFSSLEIDAIRDSLSGANLVQALIQKESKKTSQSGSKQPAIGSLVATIKSFFGSTWRESVRGTGRPPRPSVVVITPSAVRATEIVKALRQKLGAKSYPPRIAKCFARHMKVKQQLGFLRTGGADIAVGTPARIHTLCDRAGIPGDSSAAVPSVLSRDSTRLVCFDSQPNVKGYSIFTTRDIENDVLKLMQAHVVPTLGPAKLCLF